MGHAWYCLFSRPPFPKAKLKLREFHIFQYNLTVAKIHLVDKKNVLEVRIGTYERNADEEAHRYRHVFATEREIFIGNFPSRVISTLPILFINNETE